MHGMGTPAGPRRFFNGQSPEQPRLRLADEQVIFRQDDEADALYFVEQGWIKVTSVAASGKETVLLVGADEFFGTRCLIAGHRRMATAVTLTGCTLIRVTRPTVMRMLREDPDFAETFTAYLVRQSIRREESMIDYLTNSSERRLARALLLLLGDPDGDTRQPIATPVTQATLANMIGTTRSRVSFFMSRFRRRGYVEYDRQGHVTVCNSRLKHFLAG